MFNRALAITVLSISGLVSTSAQAEGAVILENSPQIVLASSSHGDYWSPGYWEWQGDYRVWINGYWVRERPQYRQQHYSQQYYKQQSYGRHHRNNGRHSSNRCG